MAQTTEELYLIVHPGSIKVLFFFVCEGGRRVRKTILQCYFAWTLTTKREWGGEGES